MKYQKFQPVTTDEKRIILHAITDNTGLYLTWNSFIKFYLTFVKDTKKLNLCLFDIDYTVFSDFIFDHIEIPINL